MERTTTLTLPSMKRFPSSFESYMCVIAAKDSIVLLTGWFVLLVIFLRAYNETVIEDCNRPMRWVVLDEKLGGGG